MQKKSPTIRTLHFLVGALCVAASWSAAAAVPFTLTSPEIADGGLLNRKHAADANECGGRNISPALQWRHAPAGTQSYAVTLFDPEGGHGMGIVHWVVYNLAATTHGLPENAGAALPAGAISGINRTGKPGYFGPCPPVGDTPHHYFAQVYALDLAPGAIPPNLSRDALFDAMRGHVLGSNGIVLRYGRP